MATPALSGSASNARTSGSVSSLTWSHTSNGDPLLVITSALAATSGVTFNGSALTLVGQLVSSNSPFYIYELWALASPGSTTANIVLTSGSNSYMTGAGYNVQNADFDLVPPSGLVDSVGSSTTPSVAVTSLATSLVLDLVVSDVANQDFTEGGSQTLIYEQVDATTNNKAAGSSQPGAASVTMDWTLSATDAWVQFGFSVDDPEVHPPMRLSAAPLLTLTTDTAPAMRLSAAPLLVLSQEHPPMRLSAVPLLMLVKSPPVQYEDPCAITGPRVHMKLDTGDEVLRYAVHPLRDSTALGGFKEPRLLEVSPIVKAASDVASGAWSVQSATVTLADTDRALRDVSATRGGLKNCDAEIYLTSTPQRLAGGPPRVLFAGQTFRNTDAANLAMSLEINDIFGVHYTLFAEERMLPQRVVSIVDFPRAPEESLGLGVPIIGGRIERLKPGHPTVIDCVYVGQVLVGGSPNVPDGATLAAVVADLQASHTANSLYDDWGKRIGYHRATRLQGAASVPATYNDLADYISEHNLDNLLEDYAVTGGTLYETVLVAGHAVKEILKINIADVAIDNAERGVSWWAPQISGDTSWAADITTDRFLDILGTDGETRRYTPILFEVGSTYGDAVADGAQVHVDVLGFETVGDGTGDAITGYFDIYEHILQQFVLQNYQTGTWLPKVQFLFSDGETLIDRIDHASFVRAAGVSTTLVDGGFLGAVVLGHGGERTSLRTVIQTFNFSAGCFLAQDDYGRVFVYLLDRRRAQFFRNPVTSAIHATVRDKADILPGFYLEPKPEWQVNSVEFQYAYHHHTTHWNRRYGGGGSLESPVQDATSQARDGVIRKEMQYLYLRDDATALAVASHYLAMLKDLPRVAHYARRGLCGLEDDLCQGVPITHYNGEGANGWVDHGVLILSKTFHPKTMHCEFTALDVESQLS